MATTTGKPLIVGIVACSNSLPNSNSLPCAQTGGIVVTASLVARKVYGKQLAATAVVVTATGTPRQVGKSATATVVVTGSLGKRANKTLTATAVAVTGTFGRALQKTLTASAAITATITRRVGKLLTTTASATAGLVPTFIPRGGITNPQALTASVTATATLTFQVVRTFTRTLSATVSTSATLSAVFVPYVPPPTVGGAQDFSPVLAAV